MNSTTACPASAPVANRLRQCISFFSVAKNDSATVLSRQLPVRLQESRTSLARAHSAGSLLACCAPRSVWNMALPATYPRDLADSSAATAMSAVMRPDSDHPTTMRVFRSITVARCSRPSPVRR